MHLLLYFILIFLHILRITKKKNTIQLKELNDIIIRLSENVNDKNYLDIIIYLQNNKYDTNNFLIDNIIKEEDEEKK